MNCITKVKMMHNGERERDKQELPRDQDRQKTKRD